MSRIVGMRGLLTSSIGVTCAAALALPLTPPASAAPAPTAPSAEVAPVVAPDAPDLSGSTQSLPLTPLTRDRAAGAAEQGVPRRDVRPFSLLGVVWDDPDTDLDGTVQVRTRKTGTGAWSGWQDVETHYADHGADPDSAERASGHPRGATAPLWVGDSDGVEVRVRPDASHRAEGTVRGTRTPAAPAPLPAGLRLELVDPGDTTTSAARSKTAEAVPDTAVPDTAVPDTAVPDAVFPDTPDTATGARHGADAPLGRTADFLSAAALSDGTVLTTDPATTRTAPSAHSARSIGAGTPRTAASAVSPSVAASAANAALAPLGASEISALDAAGTRSELLALRGGELTKAQRAKPYIGPRPRIVTRHGWGADEKLRESGFRYTSTVKAAFVHHSATGNSYKCSQAPSVIRSIYRYHVKSLGWRDIGYNFVVDKCGTIYEGRAGGVAKAVLGAHTLGFNTNSMGIAVLGTFTSTKPSSATVKAVASLTAWKLGLFGGNPKGKTYLKSGGGNLYPKGKNVRLNVISGHRDGFATECPGRQLYGKLGSARNTAATYQGR
ncbi:N-acetylmuramoyl-L-alanine amidase [Streptomyces antibioticus]|uniref:N-acetylmuramoyl-L-alanine amidase n=2 Tax=Streptomyces antibioticus TaxID=1890 RepID=A0AAE6Y7M1_STRAT|nr:N-acetylmuramoyl-L-alanine amidase [Streptomyces antibioticus]QIT44868.1 peptidoglycan recognition protein [Streptomyces antibioticus]